MKVRVVQYLHPALGCAKMPSLKGAEGSTRGLYGEDSAELALVNPEHLRERPQAGRKRMVLSARSYSKNPP